MSSQPEMFPMTEEERIALLRKNLQSDVDKRQGKVNTAESALTDARDDLTEALGLLNVFDEMVRVCTSVESALGQIVVDAVTGEVES